MILTRQSLPRRTVLRGLGVSLALPLLDAMVPAMTAAPAPVKRLSTVYVGMGMNMDLWTPASEGPLDLSPILQPIAAFRDRTLVLSGFDSKEADAHDGGVHPRCQTAWLTGSKPFPTEGPGIRAGISMDQIAAAEFESETQLASMELALESFELAGACNFGYSCAYNNTLCWRNATTPIPMEVNPRVVFERMFGTADSTDQEARLAYVKKRRSILDAVSARAAALNARIGASDRQKVDQYLDAVRDVERRIQKAEEQIDQEIPVVDQPVGVPGRFEDHARLMFDLLALAYQTDLTRVGTFMVAKEQSNRAYPEIGVAEPHHPLSHHQNNPEKLAKQAKVNVFHMQLFAHFLEKLQATPDGDGSLLDHTVVLYGSGMSDSNLHLMWDVPTMVVGSSTFGIAGGRHVRHPKGTPLANLQLTLLDKMGVRLDRFGDSSGKLNLVSL
ncbi:MAG: DUF1552 domain-containing protein [Acidimicrobiia bacterium]|nr:DUF1552 domain-containing protein [Acidimicrobiia bacterium]